MTKIERLRAKRDELVFKKGKLMQRLDIIGVQKLQSQIDAIDKAIKEAEEYEPHRLRDLIDKETLNKSGLAIQMVKVHLAADFLADCAHELRDIFDSLGLIDHSIRPKVETIRKHAQDFANIVCHPEFAGLADFMVTNDKFINDMHTICNLYIKQHLTITDN